MPTIKLNLDLTTYRILTAQAVDECRPIILQAEVVLRRGLGTFPDLAGPVPVPADAREAPGEIPHDQAR
jgi:hypothetical protein